MTVFFLRLFFNVDHFKVFIQFVTVLLLFYTLAFWQWGMWSLSSPLRNQTHTPCTRRRRPATELPGKSQDPHYGSFSPTTLGLVMFTPAVPAYLQLHERFFSFTHACPVLPCIHLIGSYWSWRLNLDKKAPWDPWGGRRTFLRGFSPRFIKLPTSWSLSPTVFFPKSRDVCFTFQKPTLSLLSIKRLLNQLCKVIPKFWDHFQVQLFMANHSSMCFFGGMGGGAGTPHIMWDQNSPTRDWSCTLALEAWSLNHWTAREVPQPVFIVNAQEKGDFLHLEQKM